MKFYIILESISHKEDQICPKLLLDPNGKQVALQQLMQKGEAEILAV